MDCGNDYIKMCEKAEEIQGIWNHEQHFLDRPHSYIVDNGRSGWTWLPRQDQLQEMVGSDWRYIFSKFMWWYTDVDIRQLEIIGSMEQLWLAFVMKEKFNKIWDGNKWE